MRFGWFVGMPTDWIVDDVVLRCSLGECLVGVRHTNYKRLSVLST